MLTSVKQRNLITIFAECAFNYCAQYAMYFFADSAGWPGLRRRTLQPTANALEFEQRCELKIVN